MKIAIIGASGLVGRKMLQVLVERQVKVNELYLAASEKSAGSMMNFEGYNFPLNTVSDVLEQETDVALFSAGVEASVEWALKFAEKGTFVIDNSSAWRMADHIPLIVPEVNGHKLHQDSKIIANPNCSTIQLVAALFPLHLKYKLKRVIVSTYQSVSGSGKRGIDQLMNERRGIRGEAYYPYPIDHNVLAQGGMFNENGYSSEEIKLMNESRKILGLPDLNITCTVVRVPVISCHSESVNVEFENDFNLLEIREILRDTKGITVLDEPEQNVYPMPLLSFEKDEVFVGRLRRDLYNSKTLNMWIVADNVRKGAATNAVQILQMLADKGIIPA